MEGSHHPRGCVETLPAQCRQTKRTIAVFGLPGTTERVALFHCSSEAEYKGRNIWSPMTGSHLLLPFLPLSLRTPQRRMLPRGQSTTLLYVCLPLPNGEQTRHTCASWISNRRCCDVSVMASLKRRSR